MKIFQNSRKREILKKNDLNIDLLKIVRILNIDIGRKTYFSLHSLWCLFNLKIQIKFLRLFMQNFEFKEQQFKITDPVESYFECISYCDIKDGVCISKCVEKLREYKT